MAASSSANACCLRFSSMPFAAAESSLVLAAAVPKALLVEDRAETPDLTFVLLLMCIKGKGKTGEKKKKKQKQKKSTSDDMKSKHYKSRAVNEK